jgi:hypothetical protein
MRRAIRRLIVAGLYALKSAPVAFRTRARAVCRPSLPLLQHSQGFGRALAAWRRDHVRMLAEAREFLRDPFRRQDEVHAPGCDGAAGHAVVRG